MTPVEAAVLIGLASWRLWRLVARDDITEPFHSRLQGWPHRLVDCPWCLGTWIAAAVTFSVDQVHPLPVPWLIAGTAAGIVGFTEMVTQRLTEP